MDEYSPKDMDSINNPILKRICQRGISVNPSLSMFWTGAVAGNRVNITEKVPLGKANSKEENHSGTKPSIT